jgi:hypothetical protein
MLGRQQNKVSMNEWFRAISETCELPAGAVHELYHRGFVVLPQAVPRESVGRLTDAYNAAVSSAIKEDTKA